MLGKTVWLTAATLLGLASGFAREWLLVTSWGAGQTSDAFLVALFLPEAVRMTLAGGLLASAALPLYLQRNEPGQCRWLNGLVPVFLLGSILISLVLIAGSSVWVRLMGPGLAQHALAQAADNLNILALSMPAFFLHALFSIPLQARERFVLVGLGSLLFNLPPVIYLWLAGSTADDQALALACVLGSLLMLSSLLPSNWYLGWRPWLISGEKGAGRQLYNRLGPLLSSTAASHGLALLERLVASLLGEGTLTWVNLARKLINLPLIALMSLNQVLLSLMSARQGQERLRVLKSGIKTTTLLSLPAAVGLIATSPTLVSLLLPEQSAESPLPALLAWFSVPLVFGSWNALLARYAYADSNTRLPLRCELAGSLVNALLLALLPPIAGLIGLPLAALGGVITTGLLLMQRQGLLAMLPWAQHWGLSLGVMGLAAWTLFGIEDPWQQLSLGVAAGTATLLILAIWLRPWRLGD